MMAKLLTASHQSFVGPLQLRFPGSTDRTYAPSLGCRSQLGAASRAICGQRQQKSISRWPGTRFVVSDTKAPNFIIAPAGQEEEIDIQPDNSDGGGLGGAGGSEGGGGGGGGDDNNSSNEAEGGPGESDFNQKKMAMSMSQKLTLGYAALIGVGGVMGFLKSGSKNSLIAGGLSASVLYYVYTELPMRPAFASSIGFGISAALLVVMGSRFKNSGKIFPAGVVSLVSVIMSGGYLHGILRSLH